ncbi:MAG: methylated-DNA--[protein]-cysteine S-methyltransferase [Erysipelotrichaceae bacterium]|nr:methylated-DNA--[protein]-cysteine S-methyltransferase [Erysipelotrichaceae bacterium]
MRNLPKLYNETEHYCWYDSPIGILKIAEDDQGITEVSFQEEIGADQKEGSLYLEKTLRQLEEYFAGIRRSFDVPLSLKGTEFQMKVWHALKEIPYGHTACYQEVAAMIGNEKASRAIGNANHHNPVVIIVPCHRVIRADGSIGGYGGGIERKKYLLNLEGIKL